MNPYLQQLRNKKQEDEFGLLGLPNPVEMASEGMFNIQAAMGETMTKYKGLFTKLLIGGVVVGVGAFAYKKIQEGKELEEAEGSMNQTDDSNSADQLSLFEVTETDEGDVITQQLLEQSAPMGEMVSSALTDDEDFESSMLDQGSELDKTLKGSSNMDRLMYGSGGPPKRTRRRSQPTTSGMRGKIGPSARSSDPMERYFLGSGNEKKQPWYELNGDPSGLTGKKMSKSKTKDPFLGSKMEMPTKQEEEEHLGKGFLDNVKPLF